MRGLLQQHQKMNDTDCQTQRQRHLNNGPKTSDQENHQIIDFMAPTQYRYCGTINIHKYSELKFDLKLL